MKSLITPILAVARTTCFLTLVLTANHLLASPQDDSTDATLPSHVAESTDGTWLKHAAEGSNAEIMMPATPRFSERTFRPVADEPFIHVKTWLCSANKGQVLFTMSYHDLHKHPHTLKQQQQVLDGAVKGAVAQVVGSSTGATSIKVRIYPGRKFTYDFALNGQELRSDAEVYLIGKRQYMLSTIFKQSKYDPELSKRYFETFNPFDPQEAPASDSASDDGTNQPSESPASSSPLNGFDLPAGEQPVELK